MYLSIGQAAIFLGVSISTLRRWDFSKYLLPAYRTTGGHRRYSLHVLKKFVGMIAGEDKRKVIGYARVSSHDQKNDLIRQVKRLDDYCRKISGNYEVIDDLGSGLNYKKRGLNKLIKLIIAGQVSRIILTHKDRLLRFGSEILFTICSYFNTNIEIIDENEKVSDEQKLAYDVLEIITVFSARLYGKRAHQKKKIPA